MSKSVAFPRSVPGVAAVPPAERQRVAPVSDTQPDPERHRSEADLRLVIEEDETTGSFVYKTLDRRTGEIVQQMPREEVLRLKDAPDYAPGQVVDAKR